MYQVTYISKFNDPSVLLEMDVLPYGVGFVSVGGFFYRIVNKGSIFFETILAEINENISNLKSGQSFSIREFSKEPGFRRYSEFPNSTYYQNFGIYSIICSECLNV